MNLISVLIEKVEPFRPIASTVKEYLIVVNREESFSIVGMLPAIHPHYPDVPAGGLHVNGSCHFTYKRECINTCRTPSDYLERFSWIKSFPDRGGPMTIILGYRRNL